MAVDPVCGMKVEPQEAAAKEEHGGQAYFFCSEACHKSFVAEPHKYSGESKPATRACCG